VAGGDLKPDGHEQRQLLQLVRLQAADIEALRAEIQLLSHKGGHILPPSQPPINTHAQPPLSDSDSKYYILLMHCQASEYQSLLSYMHRLANYQTLSTETQVKTIDTTE